MLLVQKNTLILKLLLGRDGIEHIRYYQRKYLYVVSGQEYTLNVVETDIKPYKTIKYNPSNPNEAETYEGINRGSIVVFFIGLISIFSPFILKITNTKKITSKRNIIKITTGCFWAYLGLSLIFILKEIFLGPNWNQIVMQYSKSEIIIECITYIIARHRIKKYTRHFNIFRHQISN